jgi:hypothetical protein
MGCGNSSIVLIMEDQKKQDVPTKEMFVINR